MNFSSEKFNAITDGMTRRLLNLNEPGARPWPSRAYGGGKEPD